MRFITHFLFSILGFFLFLQIAEFVHCSLESYFPVNSLLVVAFFLFLGTILPDIDTTSSRLGKKTPFFLKPLRLLIKHRGFFHSVLAGLLLAYLIAFLAPIKYSLVFLLAYFLHILLDGFTPKGVKAFWPLPFRFKGRIRTGKLEESFLCLVFLVSDIILLFIFIGH